ncbi:MAG: Bug family tripartite tricarboxylate transporter substrate binding protein [Lautropia sp.]
MHTPFQAPARRRAPWRSLLAAVAAVLGLLSLAAPVAAAWPEKPIRIIVPAAPGGGVDILSRNVGKKMADDLGVAVVVENRPGGNSNIGFEAAAKAAPDGYTIVMGYTGLAILPHLFAQLPWNPEGDYAPLATVGSIPLVLVANTSFPPNTVAELIAYIKANPASATYAHGGAGGMSQLGGEMFKLITKVNVTPVPYKGNAPALADVVAGHVPFMWDTINTAMPQVRNGRLKVLAMATPKRVPAYPNTPTMIEEGVPGFELAAWYMMLAPKATPAPILDRLNAAINKALTDPEVAKTLGDQGVVLAGGSRDEATKYLRSELERWGGLIKSAGIKAE